MEIIEDKDKIVITTSKDIDVDALRRLIDCITVFEIASQNRGSEEQAEALAREINAEWWAQNKSRFL